MRAFIAISIFISIASSNAQAAEKKARESEKPAEKAEAPERREKPVETAMLVAPKGPARVDFDDRLLQGQSNRLGAVYLYQRKEPVLPSLLDRRKSFRSEIKRDVLE